LLCVLALRYAPYGAADLPLSARDKSLIQKRYIYPYQADQAQSGVFQGSWSMTYATSNGV